MLVVLELMLVRICSDMLSVFAAIAASCSVVIPFFAVFAVMLVALAVIKSVFCSL